MSEERVVYSIQTVYNLYSERTNSSEEDKLFKIRCKNVIEVPVAEPVSRIIDKIKTTAIPVTAITVENDEFNLLGDIKIVIETNEGVTVEPTIVEYPNVLYNRAYLLYLPRGATGIKKVSIRGYDAFGSSVLNDLTFDVMEAPYNYENYLSVVLQGQINYIKNKMQSQFNVLDKTIASLESRVSALENKAGN